MKKPQIVVDEHPDCCKRDKSKIIEMKHRDVVKLDGMYFSVNTKTKQMTHIAEEEIEESRTWE